MLLELKTLSKFIIFFIIFILSIILINDKINALLYCLIIIIIMEILNPFNLNFFRENFPRNIQPLPDYD